jgi:hypothetical protein
MEFYFGNKVVFDATTRSISLNGVNYKSVEAHDDSLVFCDCPEPYLALIGEYALVLDADNGAAEKSTCDTNCYIQVFEQYQRLLVFLSRDHTIIPLTVQLDNPDGMISPAIRYFILCDFSYFLFLFLAYFSLNV